MDQSITPVNGVSEQHTPDAPRRSGFERLERYRRQPEQTHACILSRHGIGTPAIVEVEGQLLSANRLRDEEHTRWVLEVQHCEAVIEQLAGHDGRSALLKYYGLHRDFAERRKLALIKEVGRFLLSRGQLDLWRLLYLHLKEGAGDSAACDTITNAFPVDGYDDGDEYRFLWGSGWQERLEDFRENKADNARLRREIDGAAAPATEAQP